MGQQGPGLGFFHSAGPNAPECDIGSITLRRDALGARKGPGALSFRSQRSARRALDRVDAPTRRPFSEPSAHQADAAVEHARREAGNR